MLSEVPLFGALAPGLLLYFLAAVLLFVLFDRMLALFGLYRFLWHPPLARLGLFLCIFSGLALWTGQ